MTDLQKAFRKSKVCRELSAAVLKELGEDALDAVTVDACCDYLATFDDDYITNLLEQMQELYPMQCRKLLAVKRG